MGQNQYHLDVLVLPEIRHALDKAGQNAPTEIVGAAEKGCAEFGSHLPQPPHGVELGLLVGLLGDLGDLAASAVLLLREPVDGLPDERRVDSVAEPVQLGQLLLMEFREPAL